MYRKVKVTPKEDGAVISVEGYDITITVKPTEVFPLEVLPSPKITIESVRSKLTEYLEEVEVVEEEENIVVKPKGFLGRDRFALIATIVDEVGGRYISAGKESRFIVPKE